MGVRKFKIFLIEDSETIDEMYARFTTIINELRSLGKTYTTHEKIKKILRSLPSTLRHMATAITQSKDLKIIGMDELIGTLRARQVLLSEDNPIMKGKMKFLSRLLKFIMRQLMNMKSWRVFKMYMKHHSKRSLC